MKLLITLGLLAMLVLGAAGCGTDDQPDPATTQTTSTSVTIPSDPKTRMAIRPNDDGSVSVFAQWFSSGQGEGSWNRVVLSRVSAEQLAETGRCFNTRGREVGDGTVLVRGVVCPVLRERERRIRIYIQARRPDDTWSEKQVLGEIGEEKQQKVGTTFFTSKFSYPVRAADYAPPERTPGRSTSSPCARVYALERSAQRHWDAGNVDQWHAAERAVIKAMPAGGCPGTGYVD